MVHDEYKPIRRLFFKKGKHKTFLEFDVRELQEMMKNIVADENESHETRVFFAFLHKYLNGEEVMEDGERNPFFNMKVENFLSRMFIATADATEVDTTMLTSQLAFAILKRNLSHKEVTLTFNHLVAVNDRFMRRNASRYANYNKKRKEDKSEETYECEEWCRKELARIESGIRNKRLIRRNEEIILLGE